MIKKKKNRGDHYFTDGTFSVPEILGSVRHICVCLVHSFVPRALKELAVKQQALSVC